MRKISHLAYVALGSNLNHPTQQIQTALQTLQQWPQLTVTQTSRLYRSAPLGITAQSDFINAVVAIKTTLSPLALLEVLQTLEQRHGRVRTLRWGPRTLDCDIILFDQLTLNTERLTIPHPECYQRHFVLYPLADIAPTLIFPNGTPLTTLLTQVPPADLTLVDTENPCANY